jgi:hypothetical protein
MEWKEAVVQAHGQVSIMVHFSYITSLSGLEQMFRSGCSQLFALIMGNIVILVSLQELLRLFADDGGIYRHRWSDQSTFPLILGTFDVPFGVFGGECVYFLRAYTVRDNPFCATYDVQDSRPGM